MNNATKKTVTMRLHASGSEASRKALMQTLAVGESVIFLCEPGQAANKLQSTITSSFRGSESLSQQGLEQRSGLIVFEGEPAVAVARVTRVREPE